MSNITREELSCLTIAEIRNLVDDELVLDRDHRQKNALLDFVLEKSPPQLLASLRDAIDQKNAQKKEQVQTRKRKRTNHQLQWRKAARIEETDPATEDRRDITRFLELPSRERVKECYREFYEATSNEA